MASGIITEIGRKKLCRAHAGDISLPKIAKMAFGTGGVDEAGNVLPVSGDETSLKNELDRKTVESHIFMERDTTCRYSVRLNKEELAQQPISEQGLLDEDGDLIAYKTFLPKWKDGDMEFVFEMDEIF